MRVWLSRDRGTMLERLQALQEVVATGAGRLPADLLDVAQAVLDRAGERHALSIEHTVVALAGATGSGKSSLFNRIAGMEVSRVGVRRPTTSDPLACVWGTQGVGPLLEWLGVPASRQVSRESVLDSGEADDLDGLVLLDLPDHDSLRQDHQAAADRLIEMVDLFVWVLDPQKYADAALHDRYLRPLAPHEAVTVVVLNQVDRLAPDDVVECVTHLRGLLEDDGLDDAPVVALSAATGAGLPDLLDLIRTVVTKRRAAHERLDADVRMTAELIARAVDDGDLDGPETAPADLGDAERDRLVAAVAEASGVDVVAETAGRSYLRRARAATGWPLTRWVARRRSDPTRPLGVDPTDEDASRALARLSLPAPTPVQKAHADAAVRQFGEAASELSPPPWRASIRSVTAASAARLSGALDRAVVAADLNLAYRPSWWRNVNVAQWLSLLTAAAGLAWLGALTLSGGVSMPVDVPGDLPIDLPVDLPVNVPESRWFGVPAASLLLVGGLVVGPVIAGVCHLIARRAARRWAAWARQRLFSLVERTVTKVVWQPVVAELDRCRAFRRALERAQSR